MMFNKLLVINKNMNIQKPEIFVDDVIIRISYWDDIGMLEYTTKHEELHFNIRGLELDFISGKTLSISCPSVAGGLYFDNESLNIDQWDESANKIDMSQHSLFKNLINQKITEIQVWWCDSLWEPKVHSKLYQQDVTINTENGGYLLCSSAEAEANEPAIYLIDSDELVVITEKKIAKKHLLEQYGKGNAQRYKTNNG